MKTVRYVFGPAVMMLAPSVGALVTSKLMGWW